MGPGPQRGPDGKFQFSTSDFEHLRDNPAKVRVESAVATETYEESLRAAFDYDQDRFFFWRERRLSSGEASRYPPAQTAGLSLSPESTIKIRGHGSPELDVAIEPAADLTARNPRQNPTIHPTFVPVLDARTMGTGGYRELSYDRGRTFMGPPATGDVVVNDLGNGIRTLVWTRVFNDATPDVRSQIYTWTCDASQGFQPIRFERKEGPPPESVKNPYPPLPPFDEAQYSWTFVNEVWVLKSLDLLFRDGRVTEQWQLSFDWQSVNKPVPAESFDWKSWHLNEGSEVVDLRHDPERPIVIERVGQATEVPIAPPRSNGNDGFRWWMLLFSLCVTSLLAGLLVRRSIGPPS
ncbi:MAG: hypothetical protein ACK5Q5_00150 [Planctomycetaceae bacterium]